MGLVYLLLILRLLGKLTICDLYDDIDPGQIHRCRIRSGRVRSDPSWQRGRVQAYLQKKRF